MTDKPIQEIEHTPLPWHWYQSDGSFWGLAGPKDEYDHVLWSEVCKACRERGAICTAPNKADREFIATACNTFYEREAEIKRLRGILREIEWADDEDGVKYCRVCRSYKEDGHDTTCPLAVALKEKQDASTKDKD